VAVAESLKIRYLVDSGGPYEAQFDVSSVRIQGPIRHAWGRLVSKTGVCEYGLRCSYYLNYVAVNCSDETYRYENVFVYYADGRSDSQGPKDLSKIPWDRAPPGSLQDSINKAICNAK
jgi:hypothetical protein